MSTRYTQTEEAERLIRMYNRRSERVAFAVVLLMVGMFSYIVGQDSQFRLVTQSYNNSVEATRLLTLCTQTMAQVMHEVLLVDAGLHQKLRELPPIVWKVQP